MKQQNLVLLKKPITQIPVTGRLTSQPEIILADSLEIMEIYYTDRIAALTLILDQLNLLNNAKEITFICKEVAMARKILRSILLKKKFR